MFPRAILSAVLISAAVSVSATGSAQELREPRARVAVDLPDGWKTEELADYVMAYPDESFHLRMLGVAGSTDETQAEQVLFRFLEHHLAHVAITERSTRVEYGDYAGYEVRGTGNERSGGGARWFAMMLTDKRDVSNGVVVLATGTTKGYGRHRPVVVEALQKMRGY